MSRRCVTRIAARAGPRIDLHGMSVVTASVAETSVTRTRTTYREALRAALREALQRDERVFLMGEDVGRYGGCYAVSLGLLLQG